MFWETLWDALSVEADAWVYNRDRQMPDQHWADPLIYI